MKATIVAIVSVVCIGTFLHAQSPKNRQFQKGEIGRFQVVQVRHTTEFMGDKSYNSEILEPMRIDNVTGKAWIYRSSVLILVKRDILTASQGWEPVPDGYISVLEKAARQSKGRKK